MSKQNKQSILEQIKRCRVFEILRKGSDAYQYHLPHDETVTEESEFMIIECCDGEYHMYTTREELLRLAKELRQIAQR